MSTEAPSRPVSSARGASRPVLTGSEPTGTPRRYGARKGPASDRGIEVEQGKATDGGQEPGSRAGPGSEAPRLPERLRLIDDEIGFIGRVTETETLGQAWSEVEAGGLRLALVGGEPGIGKTRLAAHRARLAHSAGARVLYGRSEAELAIPVQAFAEAFGAFTTELEGAQLAELAAQAPALGRIVPAVKRHLPHDEEPARDEQPPDQHELFEAGTTLLAAASDDRPLLLILDDIHWADQPTALMLRYLTASPKPLNAMVLATYRTTEIESDSWVASTLLDLQRQPNVIDMVLEGLDPDDSLALAAELAGHRLSGAELTLAEMLHTEAAGNPLFLLQLIRNLSEAGEIDRVAGRWSLRRRIEAIELPGTVTETVRSRVERLGPEVAAVLASAAVIGAEFDAETLQAVAETDAATVAAALDRATEADLIARTEGGRPFGFTHPLISRVLYDGVGAASRGAAHRRAATALEKLLDGVEHQRAPEVARHWLEALPAEPAKARSWAQRAGEQALEQFEADAAARWFNRALGLELEPEPEARCDLLIGLGIAQRMSGQAQFRETLLAAARLAADLDHSERLVEAALANNRGFASASGTVDAERIAVLEMALERVGEAESEARALLTATLAAELSFSGEWERRVELSDEALRMARSLDRPRTLSKVLTARFVPIWMPETLEERLDNSEENVAIADRVGRPQEQFGAVHWRSVALLQAGEIEPAVAAIEREQQLAQRLGDPTALWIATYDRGNLATLFGRLEEAESLANEALQIASDSGQPDALPFFGSQIANIRYEQGRIAELQELLAQVVADNPGLPAFRALLALAYVDSGLPERGRDLLAMELETGFEEIPRDVTWLAGHVIYAHVAAALEEPAAAELLYRRIAPFASQIVYTGISSWGDCDHALGRLAATLGHYDDADRHLVAARERAREAGAAVWAVRAAIDGAEALLKRGRPGDVDPAVGLLDDALADAQRLDNAALADRATNLARHARSQQAIGPGGRSGARFNLRGRGQGAGAGSDGNGDGPPDGAAAPAPPATNGKRALLSCEGDTWSLSYRGRTLRLRDAKGVRYLASLLAEPGVERHAVDLQSGPAGPAPEGAPGAAAELDVRAAGGDAGAVLDPEAKRAYRERIEELREQIEEAEGFNDTERASRAREELEFVGRELAAAVGLGGRDRKAASGAERARVNVTRAIRKCVRRISELDPALGDHLERSLRTGSFCVYEPAASEALEWRVQEARS